MGTENRERTLQHHEKAIWRKAFEEAMKRTSIEGAERNAWKAVDVWNRAGAFNDTPADTTQEKRIDPKSNNSTIYEEAWRVVIDWLSVADDVDTLTIEDPHTLVDLMEQFRSGSVSFDEFKKRLHDLDSYV